MSTHSALRLTTITSDTYILYTHAHNVYLPDSFRKFCYCTVVSWFIQHPRISTIPPNTTFFWFFLWVSHCNHVNLIFCKNVYQV